MKLVIQLFRYYFRRSRHDQVETVEHPSSPMWVSRQLSSSQQEHLGLGRAHGLRFIRYDLIFISCHWADFHRFRREMFSYDEANNNNFHSAVKRTNQTLPLVTNGIFAQEINPIVKTPREPGRNLQLGAPGPMLAPIANDLWPRSQPPQDVPLSDQPKK